MILSQTFYKKAIGKNLPLLALSLFSAMLLLVRLKLTGSIFFSFLIWNLFLAGLPLLVSEFAISSPSLKSKWYLLYPTLLIWLLLLPNAPYIITDFVHLRRDTSVPVWFDVLLLTSFTLSGLLYGLASMGNIYKLLQNRFSSNTANLVIISVCLLSGFGLYLGRFLRYNSWDVLQKPASLATDIFMSLFSPDTYRIAWGITLGFGVLQFLLFMLYKPLNIKKILT